MSVLDPNCGCPFTPQSTGTDQLVITPQTTLVEGVPVPLKPQSLRVAQGRKAKIVWFMKDQCGNPVDLTDLQAAGATVKFLARESLSMCANQGTTIDLGGTIDLPSEGQVSAQLTDAVVQRPGIYAIDVGLLQPPPDGSLVFSNRFFLTVEQGLFGAVPTDLGPPSVPLLRLWLRDVDPDGNLWLASFEWDDTEIAACLVRPLQEFNEAPPPLDTVYNTQTFPYPYNWTRAAQGYLLEMASLWYMRVHLPYQAGGLSIDDKNKFDVYWQRAQQMLQEWRQWLRFTKVRMNANGAYMTLGSSYSNFGWY
jgi:hypothetical protein